ncbi:unnamed protein product, partial [Vitis vinifera]|uniref:Uncharacterized protein n=1 Tax=Vitis vinifera TaxID=29760 RepID=D7TU43_VITVI
MDLRLVERNVKEFEDRSRCYICKNNFFVLCFEWLSCFHMERLNLFTSEKGSSVFWWTVLTPLFPGVTLPFFLSIAFLCFRLKLQPTKLVSEQPIS